jgi:hypothetical protein
MSLPLVIAATAALAVPALALLRFRVAWSQRRLAPPVSEAVARAHAMPLTKSVLSVSPSARKSGTGGS